MANVLYDTGREGILDESVHMNTGDIRVMLVKSGYVFAAAHRFLADMGAVDNGRSASLSGKTFTDGVFDAADAQLNAIAAVACDALAIYQHTGSDASARLVAYINAPTAGLPVTPSASQVVDVEWSNEANRIFKL